MYMGRIAAKGSTRNRPYTTRTATHGWRWRCTGASPIRGRSRNLLTISMLLSKEWPFSRGAVDYFLAIACCTSLERVFLAASNSHFPSGSDHLKIFSVGQLRDQQV